MFPAIFIVFRIFTSSFYNKAHNEANARILRTYIGQITIDIGYVYVTYIQQIPQTFFRLCEYMSQVFMYKNLILKENTAINLKLQI